MDLSAISSQLDALAKVIDPLPAAKVADLAKAQVRLLRAMLTPAQAKTSMDAFFAIMTPYAKPECDPPIATLYNEGVTFARSKKILVKNDYLKLPPPTGPAYVTYQLLLSERFKSFPGGEDRVLGGFHQYDQYGRTIRDVSIELFRWDKHYAADGKVFGGAEAKGLARLVQGFRKDEFSKITATEKLQKGVFAKGMPPSEFFDMQGVDGSGSPLRVRVHFVKGKEAPVTYALSITDHGKLPDGDPEMKEILDSFVEVPKR